MRFEVKGGGVAAIVLAVTILSGAVFVMGLLAGYDVGRQAQIDTAQLATSYPLQSQPSSSAASDEPAAEPMKPAMQSAASTTKSPAAGGETPVAAASAAGNRGFAASSISPQRRPSPPSATPARPRLASTSIPSGAVPPSYTSGSPSADEGLGAAESENPEAGSASSEASSSADLQAGRRVASTAPPVRHKPYNIQIQAAMDIGGADKMMARLQKLGYPSHLVPTAIGGQRWYKVEVGPYATPEEAASAEAALRQRYDATYGGMARDNSAARSGADDSEE